MTGNDLAFLTNVLDKTGDILTSVGSPIILGMFGFGLLTLFLHFRK